MPRKKTEKERPDEIVQEENTPNIEKIVIQCPECGHRLSGQGGYLKAYDTELTISCVMCGTVVTATGKNGKLTLSKGKSLNPSIVDMYARWK